MLGDNVTIRMAGVMETLMVKMNYNDSGIGLSCLNNGMLCSALCASLFFLSAP